MHFAKAVLFKDEARAAQIITATPAQAKKLGRQVQGFDAKIWDAERERILGMGNI